MRRLALALLLPALAACGGDDGPRGPGALAGDVVALRWRALDADGRVVDAHEAPAGPTFVRVAPATVGWHGDLVGLRVGERRSIGPGDGAPGLRGLGVRAEGVVRLEVERVAAPAPEVALLEAGTGRAARPGDHLVIDLTVRRPDTDVAIVEREDVPLRLVRGEGLVEGLVQALEGRRPGARLQVVLPPEIAYGRLGHPPEIGPDETLVLDVVVRDVASPPRRPPSDR